jgi:FixJ family two-component response regulator
VADPALIEIRDLLQEIRELLRPVADAHQDEYDRRQRERETLRFESIRAQLSSDKRRKAWALIDGSRTQKEIADQAKMAQGGVSMWSRACANSRRSRTTLSPRSSWSWSRERVRRTPTSR